ncbi:peptide chain release factor 1 [Corallococcus exiguus]|uniref:peptide chain release factor 1 n=1 Tax=Corallococcus TaxID=83461 RepID=UPI000EA2CCE2|nr:MULTISPECIES: peptide chain release factor 1 [Corallococcus]RKI36075.1 peptide chain release factor 1 [Corallococcus sp. AB004]NNB90277.1 peptide chain release factor 1 [Corallococcus exiguus]NNB98115.1 peptide chain release factor 1 [Corallococcus exiguus]NNC06962.1 peptide chain release factor 1 [Corallococcus exiguus]NPC50781.1 peptide chain release factor 1 [Corallococcus exiguus]
MIDKLEEVERRFERLTADLSNPDILADTAKLQKVSKERAGLERLVETFRGYRKVLADLSEVEAWLSSSDPDEKAYAKESLPGLKEQREEQEAALKILLLPKDPNDEKNVILEIRAGAGGDEAALFAEEVMQMYLRYADRKGWKADILDMSAGNAGGVKDATVTLSGDAVFSQLKYESGVHRVQRVPATETQGRIHTSTITVSVMPEAEDVDVQINPADIEMQVMRSTGAGGQSVNTTDSAVRLIHKPSGIVVKCQQEKSQGKNRAMALRMLRAKLYDMEQERIRNERDSMRRGQVGTGDRSEKIRTYNFPQDRLTDHRIGLTVHNLPAIMVGNVDEVITACRTHYQAEALKAQTGGGRPASEA